MELNEMQVQMVTGKMVHLLFPLVQGIFPEEDRMDINDLVEEGNERFTADFLRKSIECYNKNEDFKGLVDDSVEMFVYAINVAGSLDGGDEVDPFLIISQGEPS